MMFGEHHLFICLETGCDKYIGMTKKIVYCNVTYLICVNFGMDIPCMLGFMRVKCVFNI